MKTPRRRRTPEAARGEILDAAERVLSTRAPDAVGLAEVAGAAGVSLALLSLWRMEETYGKELDYVE